MSKKTILVTGGCGYIGSHVARQLSESGHKIVVIDDLSTGFKDALIHGEELLVADISNEEEVSKLLKKHNFYAVLHFAASIQVPESVENPLKYYGNNTAKTLSLLKMCRKFDINKFVFSSTAAVYSDIPEPLTEKHPTIPANPYGRSKLMCEGMMNDLSFSSPMRFVILRYFNVAGNDPLCRMGERTHNSIHLIKVACETAVGKRPKMMIFGDDHPTPDGTCVRDYIHVEDLASAHLAALDYLEKNGRTITLNCGLNRGHSVKEVVDTVKDVSKINFKVEMGPRRPGDPASLTANAEAIGKTLAWKPKFIDLPQIVETAMNWERKMKD